jgi:hypothetical protein
LSNATEAPPSGRAVSFAIKQNDQRDKGMVVCRNR